MERPGGSHAIIIHDPKTGRTSANFGFSAVSAFDRKELLRKTFPDMDLYVVSIVSRDYANRRNQ